MNGYRKFTGALFKGNDVISKVELLLMSISMVILTAVMSWQATLSVFRRHGQKSFAVICSSGQALWVAPMPFG